MLSLPNLKHARYALIALSLKFKDFNALEIDALVFIKRY
jgi:hypothetical protein